MNVAWVGPPYGERLADKEDGLQICMFVQSGLSCGTNKDRTRVGGIGFQIISYQEPPLCITHMKTDFSPVCS